MTTRHSVVLQPFLSLYSQLTFTSIELLPEIDVIPSTVLEALHVYVPAWYGLMELINNSIVVPTLLPSEMLNIYTI